MSAEVTAAATSLGLGAAGGYALTRSGLFLPSSVRNLFDGSSFGVLKIVLSAMGTAMVAQGVYSFVKPKEWNESRSFSKGAKSPLRVILGGLVAGSGMALAGTTPFLLGPQLGAGVKSALTVLGGALAGGALYSVLEKPLLNEVSSPDVDKLADAAATLDKQLGLDYGVLAVPLGMVIYACALVLEHFYPHTRDTTLRNGHVKLPAALPIVAGTIVGAAQVPIRMMTKSGAFGTNPLSNLLGTLSLGNIAEKFRVNSLGQASGLLLFGGSILGALFAQKRHVPQVLAAPGYNNQQSFLGGLLLAIGSALVGGCLGGQTLTGGSELAIPSLVAALSALVGGVGTTAALGRL